MQDYRYIDGTATLQLDESVCVGCGSCVTVCPHRIFSLTSRKKAEIRDLDACMECGACAKNCPVEAISVTPGVGCAAHLIAIWINQLTGKEIMSGCC